jgi:hypothetical protein
MTSYPPPVENLPIFNPNVFTILDIPLTVAEGEKYFLKFPQAQGTQNFTDINVGGIASIEDVRADTLEVEGDVDFDGNLDVSGNITGGTITAIDGRIQAIEDEILNGVVNITGVQTITGDKTFQGNTTITGGVIADSITISPTEISRLKDITGNIQSQLNLKASISYVDGEITDAINDLIDGSPATLRTLNEIAEAIGDDDNFAVTIATQIGLKANDIDAVHKTGNISETITGIKTFSQDVILNSNLDVSGNMTMRNGAEITYKNETLDQRFQSIGSFYTKSESDARFVDVSGDTMTGNLTVNDPFEITYKNQTLDDRFQSIGSFYTKTEADARFVDVTGDTMTGTLQIVKPSSINVIDDPFILLKPQVNTDARFSTIFLATSQTANNGISISSYRNVFQNTTFSIKNHIANATGVDLLSIANNGDTTISGGLTGTTANFSGLLTANGTITSPTITDINNAIDLKFNKTGSIFGNQSTRLQLNPTLMNGNLGFGSANFENISRQFTTEAEAREYYGAREYSLFRQANSDFINQGDNGRQGTTHSIKFGYNNNYYNPYSDGSFAPTSHSMVFEVSNSYGGDEYLEPVEKMRINFNEIITSVNLNVNGSANITGALTLQNNLIFDSTQGQISTTSTFFDIATLNKPDYALRVSDGGTQISGNLDVVGTANISGALSGTTATLSSALSTSSSSQISLRLKPTANVTLGQSRIFMGTTTNDNDGISINSLKLADGSSAFTIRNHNNSVNGTTALLAVTENQGLSVKNATAEFRVRATEINATDYYSVGFSFPLIPLISQVHTYYQHDINSFDGAGYLYLSGIINNDSDGVVLCKSPVNMRPYSICMTTENDNNVGDTTFVFEVRCANSTAKAVNTNILFTLAGQSSIVISDSEVENVNCSNVQTIPANHNFGLYLRSASNNLASYELIVKVYFYQVG